MEQDWGNGSTVDHLALAARAGDERALERLLEDGNVRHVIYAKIRARGLTDPADVDEVFQEVQLKIARHIHTWQATAKITTWISAIAIHACLDVLRKPVLCTVALDDGEALRLRERAAIEAREAEQPQLVSTWQLLDMLPALFEQLEPRGAECMRLFFLEGLDKKRIQARLGISRGFMNAIWKRACEQLAAMIYEDWV
jgi:RNA polymerase sigma factor (sigma-70 family)